MFDAAVAFILAAFFFGVMGLFVWAISTDERNEKAVASLRKLRVAMRK